MWSCRRAAIATISFVILFCTVIYCNQVIFHWSILRSDSARAFLLAHDLWMRRPFTRYNLIVEQEGYSVKQCRQEFEVFNEKIVAVTENTCVNNTWYERAPMMHVSDMFADIEAFNLHEKCGPNGCDCDGRYAIRAVYDKKFGYPRSLVYGFEPYDSIDWLSVFSTGMVCTLIGTIHKPSMNITLKPLESA
ncbi:unnamed protein product [Adineta ricciae]|uniref:Uncharacterized protein n=1 Tax=Adineta ricciae TaxID=249248 RepID=A0A815LKJ3_ADIRI|nr:unnamed protein product [Adineta ricciae]